MCGVIFFFGILTFLILQREKEIILSHYQEATSRFVDLVVHDLVFMMTKNNPANVAQNIKAFNKAKGMKIGVVGENGLPAFGTDITVPKEIFEAQKNRHLISGNEFIFFAPLANASECHGCHSSGDRTRGMIVIKTSMEGAHAEIADTAKRLVIMALFLGLASELFLMVVMRKMILTPLEKLLEGSELLKNGHLDHRVKVHGNDEISALGSSFNHMAKSIETSHINLEKTVLEKTGELREIAVLSTEVFRGDITLRAIIEHSVTTIVDKMGYDYSVFCLIEKETGLLFQEVKRGIVQGFCDMEIPLGSDHPFAMAIRQARAAIKKHTDLNIPETFSNLAVIPLLSHQRKRCREVNLCGFEECPAFKCADERCWLINDTLCRSPQSVPGKEKIYGCLHCPAFPVTGVLVAGRKSEISASSLHSLNILAAQIASAIENQRLIEGKKEDIRKMVALNEVSAGSLQVPGASISKTIVSYAAQFSNTDAAILWLADESHMLRRAGSFGIDENLAPEALPLTNSFVGESLRSDRCTESITMEKIPCLSELIQYHGFLYAASIPLKVRDSLLGCLTVFKKRDFFMTDAEKAIIVLFASQAAAALNTSRLYASLAESEKKYRVIMNDAADAIFLLDVEGKILDVNRKAEEFTGFPKADLFLRHYSEFLLQEDHRKAGDAFAGTLADGTGSVNNLSLLRKDSSVLSVDVTRSTVEVGGEKILLAIVRDITERRQNEKTLMAAYKFSDAIFDCASSGIMVIDREGRVIKINHVGAEILRLSMPDIIGHRITDIYPETKDLFLFGMGLGREISIARPNGDTLPIGFTNSLLDDSQDAQECIIVLFRDLTEIKRLQEELRKKEYYATMGMIISGVAHEVRNPLFGITSIGQILERELELPQHKALTQAMLKEADRMKRLIDELLLYTRPMNLNIQYVDAGGLLEELRQQPGLKSDCIGLFVEVPPDVTFRADRDKIMQVFLHLLNNAIDAARSRITISVQPRDSLIEIRITDDGAGIRKEHISRIYEPFFTTKKGGTGLGLAICKKIVEDHDGSITIDSPEGGGTTVTLLLKA